MSVGIVTDPGPEQQMLLDTAMRILTSTGPLAGREYAEHSHRSDRVLRQQWADLGCFGFLVDERLGGGSVSGNGLIDAAVVAAERGAKLQPGPFVPTSLVAYTLSQATPDEGQGTVLAALISGEAMATWALSGRYDALGSETLAVEEASGGYLISGKVSGVQDVDECQWILLSVDSEGFCGHLLVPLPTEDVRLVKLEGGLDVTRQFFDVEFDDSFLPTANLISVGPEARLLIDRQIAVAALLSAAESVGAMDADFQLALEYSKLRIAFGRPIGSFQGVKHSLANTSLALEMSKGLVNAAAASAGGDDDWIALASIAKAFVGEAAIQLSHSCFQVFGGIGYTWEHDQHLFMRRLITEAYLFGSPDWHRANLWDLAALFRKEN